MAKTEFVNGDPQQGILGTVVTAEFLNAVNAHRHTGLDVDGHGALDYALDTGAANAYAVALDPALPQYITGMPLRFLAANSNTGASTLNVNSLGVKTIKRHARDLAPGDIKTGQTVTVVYDGTYFQLVTPVDLLVGEINVAENSTEVSFTGLDINAHKGYQMESYIDGNGIAANFYLFYENDTDNDNYYHQHLVVGGADGETIAAGRENNAAYCAMALGSYLYAVTHIGRGSNGIIHSITQIASQVYTLSLLHYSQRCTVAKDNLATLTIQAGQNNAIGAGSWFRLWRRG